MADTKITSLLTPQVTTNPATDVLPIVNIADTSMASSGSTRKITVNTLLGSGGTATLASATITGDLTVDTGVLKVDSLNNRVGVGTATPTSDLDIYRATGSGITSGISLRTAAGAGGDGSFIKWLGGGSNEKIAQIDGVLNGTDVGYLSFLCGNGADAMAEQYRIASSGVFSWFDGAGGTRMTLNSTGLGVGGTPITSHFITAYGPICVTGTAGGTRTSYISNASTGSIYYTDGGASYPFDNFGNLIIQPRTSAARSVIIATGSTTPVERLIVDGTGNVGIGVTPTIGKVQTNGAFATTGAVGSISTTPLANALIADFNTTCRLIATGPNTTTAGVHKFINASSNASVYLESMTLDASGNLLVGTTDATQTSGVGTKILGSGLGPYVVNPAIANSALAYTMYSTGAAAYRFYVGWAGTVFATNTTISAISDARLKENVQTLDVGLNEILALKPRKFDWKEGKGKNIKNDRGFIAQEFETVFPNLIDEWADPAPEGEAPYKSVRADLIPVLVKAIQELTARVQTLEAK